MNRRTFMRTCLGATVVAVIPGPPPEASTQEPLAAALKDIFPDDYRYLRVVYVPGDEPYVQFGKGRNGPWEGWMPVSVYNKINSRSENVITAIYVGRLIHIGQGGR